MHTTALFQAALGLTSPWKVERVEFDAEAADGRGRLDLHIDFERGGRFGCPECEEPCPAHDTVRKTWRHLDFFQHTALLHARVPRTRCAEHGVLLAGVPWARDGSGFTMLFEALVMALAAQMPIAALARLMRVSDKRLWRVLQWHVEDAREQVDMSRVTELVVDETSRAKRRKYVTLFAEPAQAATSESPATPARVLFVADGHGIATFHDFVADLAEHGGRPEAVRDVCMDMSGAFQRGVAETMPWAEITFDRFHVMKLMGDALDDARRRETKRRPELKGSRWSLLTNPENQSARAAERVEALGRLNLLTAKAYQMRLNLRRLWDRPNVEAARQYLRAWCRWVSRAARRPKEPDARWVLEKAHRLVNTLRTHEQGVLNYFRSRRTTGVLEGINSMVQAARARARGYRNPETFKTMIYLIAGNLRFDLPRAH